nr:5461_t:CDS:2 [Entrophospora candida]
MTFKKIFLIFLILLKCLLVNSTPSDPRYVHATIVVNNNLYVMGGDSNEKDFFSLDLSQAFDTTTPPWKDLTATSPLPVLSSWAKATNPPAFQGVAPMRRREFSSVSDPLTGKLYIHGGANDMKVTTTVIFKDFFTLDGNTLSWKPIGKTALNMPPPRIDHASVLIDNGIIVFIGGRESLTGTTDTITAVPMNKLTLYDTKADTWDLMVIINLI